MVGYLRQHLIGEDGAVATVVVPLHQYIQTFSEVHAFHLIHLLELCNHHLEQAFHQFHLGIGQAQFRQALHILFAHHIQIRRIATRPNNLFHMLRQDGCLYHTAYTPIHLRRIREIAFRQFVDDSAHPAEIVDILPFLKRNLLAITT